MLNSRSKTRIARKSSYVEIEAPVPDYMAGEMFPHFMHPVFIDGPDPVIWNMSHLNVEGLPILDIANPKRLSGLKRI